MQVHSSSAANEFLTQARGFLLEREAEESLPLGLATRLASHGKIPGVESQTSFFYAIEEEGKILLAAVRTAPLKLILSHGSPIAVAVLADWLARQRAVLPGVFGPVETADVFAAAWKKLSRPMIHISHSLRLYQLDQVILPPPPAGRLVPAGREHLDLLTQWQQAFSAEVRHQDISDHRQFLLSAVDEGRLFVWMEDHRPLAMAAWSRPTPNGVSINMVYTPPEYRNHGHATACVAALSRRLLDSGRKFCCLFTDLDNPVSNGIYPRIGYRPLADFREYLFESD
jgi:hypothetical protein